MIELRQLRYLLAAAEAGSFSRAARNMNIKQATLSRHILEIEKASRRSCQYWALPPSPCLILSMTAFLSSNRQQGDGWAIAPAFASSSRGCGGQQESAGVVRTGALAPTRSGRLLLLGRGGGAP